MLITRCVHTLALLGLCAVSLSVAAAAKPSAPAGPTIEQSVYGELPNGELVTQFVLHSGAGVEATIITYGGVITSLMAPDRDGKQADIVLGYDSLQGYLDNTAYFGALIGRYGNRIGKGQFKIDGKGYQLPTNDGANHLHGGPQGFDKRNWRAVGFKEDGAVGVKLQLLSEDGDQGYPGNLTVDVVYTLSDDNELTIDYGAVTDQPTIVNLTQHSYFNLRGAGDILAHELMIPADAITPVDSGLIPTGKMMPVKGTPFDFTTLTPIGKRIEADDTQLRYGKGYDHNFVLKKSGDKAFEVGAKVMDPSSGRVLEVFTTEPGMQFYSGNFLTGDTEGKGRKFEFRSGFCLEPQHYPDSPNKPDFPSTLLQPGERYETRMSYRLSVDGETAATDAQ